MNMEIIAAVGWASALMAAYQWWAWRSLAIQASEGWMRSMIQHTELDKALKVAIKDVQDIAEEVNEHIH